MSFLPTVLPVLMIVELGGGDGQINRVRRAPRFLRVAIADEGRARSAGRVATTPERLRVLALSLRPDDRVVLEATGNALAIARILAPHCAEVVMAIGGLWH